MRRPVVAGNWKMHGSRSANQALLTELERSLKPEWPIDVVVCPPFVYLSDAVRLLEGVQIGVGAQDVCAEAGGAFTGQVSAAMLKDVGCRYVIVGHSERRRLYHEDDVLVARKFAAVLQRGLDPGAVRRAKRWKSMRRTRPRRWSPGRSMR
jgi:triosephosphate isomerase